MDSTIKREAERGKAIEAEFVRRRLPKPGLLRRLWRKLTRR